MANFDPLPRWACVAFCARTAHVIRPTIERLWPDQPDSDRRILFDTIQAARDSAAAGKETGGLFDLGFKTTRMAGRFIMHVNGIKRYDDCGFPPDFDTCQMLAKAISVASKAHEAASDKNPNQVYRWAADAYEWALETVANDKVLAHDITTIYAQLHERSAENNWNHKTCVYWTDDGWLGINAKRRWWKFWQLNP